MPSPAPPDRPHDPVDPSLAQRLFDALDEPATWPAVAAAIYAPDVRWRCPRRGLQVHGREAVLARWREELAGLAGVRPVVLRRAIAGRSLVHESTTTWTAPWPPMLAAAPGVGPEVSGRVERHCTRLLTFAANGLVDELVLERVTALPPAAG